MRQGQAIGQEKRAEKRAQLELKAAIQIQSLGRMKSGRREVVALVAFGCSFFCVKGLNIPRVLALRPDPRIVVARRVRGGEMQSFETMLQLRFNLEPE